MDHTVVLFRSGSLGQELDFTRANVLVYILCLSSDHIVLGHKMSKRMKNEDTAASTLSNICNLKTDLFTCRHNYVRADSNRSIFFRRASMPAASFLLSDFFTVSINALHVLMTTSLRSLK